MTCIFTYRLHQDPPLVVMCDGSHHGGKTITNAAEEAVAMLARWVPDLTARRIVYRDTAGVWDELVIDGQGRFVEFGLLRARSELGAIEAVRLDLLHRARCQESAEGGAGCDPSFACWSDPAACIRKGGGP